MRNVKQTIILAPLAAAAALVASAPLSSRSANFNFEGCDSVPPSAREATFSIDGGDSAPLSARDATFSINREVAPVVPRSPSFPSPGLLPSETQQPRLAARDEPAAASVPDTAEQNVAGGGYKPDKGDGYGYGGYKEDKKEKKKEALKKAVEGVAQTAVEVGLKAYQGLKAAKDSKKEKGGGYGYGYGGGKGGGGKGYGEKTAEEEAAMVQHVEVAPSKVDALSDTL
ncbi:hypothetical protein MCOR27_007238 [Pyricularia oryzae]|uniref:Uncharacterized protein n=1 Tax=Pyricularia grisea TaxID=148305 RepID=A0ABQ8NY03_PYRGI|nr:hypothetical protein MCOR01_009290 [Pyricularia oryzae]KAI6303769.1 hypothetical protein MCOR33_001120 [Pyricularia grisea]KAI6261411.1 hypothetical protein MCOR19_002317 [Pyricularia oryzae]KAI6271105.1 hypothetical protein MCOR26_007946 [Pyricularia oryzae]KAI6274867.1 hypothetical protein MCOR27_007238 [Pyricularia oryzae]